MRFNPLVCLDDTDSSSEQCTGMGEAALPEERIAAVSSSDVSDKTLGKISRLHNEASAVNLLAVSAAKLMVHTDVPLRETVGAIPTQIVDDPPAHQIPIDSHESNPPGGEMHGKGGTSSSDPGGGPLLSSIDASAQGM
jgi:hypothetical protein